jgi:hypothetical protein
VAYRTVDAGVAVRGWKELTRTLHQLSSKADFGIEYELQRRLRVIGEKNAKAAERFITHKYGHTKTDPLEGSMRVSVTQNRAAVFSTSAHGGVQNVGGGPAAGWAARGPHVKRANASKFAIRGVQAEREWTQAEMEGLCDWIVEEFERGL